MAKLPVEVQELIEEHITSVAQLEVILLLRLAPERWWTVEALNTELRSSPTWLAKILHDLCVRGIVERKTNGEALFRYYRKTADLAAKVDALAQAYLIHRVRVIEAIYSKPSDGVRSFMDAFDFRKGKSDG